MTRSLNAHKRPNVMRKLLQHPVAIYLLLTACLACSICAAAQTADQTDDSTQKLLSTSPDQTPPLSADKIISLLHDDPELVLEVKNAVIAKSYEQGTLLDPQDLTDEALFRLVREDTRVRAIARHEIEKRDNFPAYPSADELNQDDTVPADRNKDEERYANDRVYKDNDKDNDKDGSDSPSSRDSFRRESSLPDQTQTDLPKLTRRPSAKRLQNAAPAQDQNLPVTHRQPNPYPGLPSLQDLYRQIPSQGAAPKRFGLDIFLNGTGNFDSLPMDLPAGPDYLLGPGDGLNINLWGSMSQKIAVTVDRGGRVTLPEAGAVVVAGHTLADAQDMIQNALNRQFKKLRIDVSLTRLRTVRIYVVGDVKRPGAYDISSLSTPLNALYVAGGPTNQGSLRTVKHYRGQQLVREVDLYDLMLRGIRSDAERMEPGDTILVPTVGPQVTVAGMVRRPAIYELRNEKELSEVLDLAGGVLVSATLRQINVERIEAHQKRIMLSLKLPASDDKDAVNKGLDNFQVQDGDRVTISPILPYSDKTVYLQGHVFRPGKYPYREGIQISELIRSYQDLLPEPAQHAEIVRLSPPDYRPTVIEFNLADILDGEDPIELQPFDTIRIFGRYEVDPPKVSIYGEVLRPGKYPLTQGMTASALVRMAGGFKRSAFTHEADVTSYVVQNGQRVVTKHETVEIAKALTGDNAADIALKPNDVLTVRELAGWSDIGASMTLKGEVLYPGTYGIEEGEKVSSLLKRAGGFRGAAYPEGAVLERVQVRELEQRSRTELIQRIETAASNPKFAASASGSEQAAMMQAMTQQQEHVVTALRNQPVTGRLVINISADIGRWQNTPNDIDLRAGDVLVIPKKPSFVLVTGQVFNPAALTYSAGKKAGWYLHQAGGPSDLANKKEIYIIRANGSVVGRAGTEAWWGGNTLNTTMRPGDSIVVPEKIMGGSNVWKNILDTAQITSNLAIAARVATSF
jgi:protein involved in polysaccharide export with SLBB domain